MSLSEQPMEHDDVASKRARVCVKPDLDNTAEMVLPWDLLGSPDPQRRQDALRTFCSFLPTANIKLLRRLQESLQSALRVDDNDVVVVSLICVMEVLAIGPYAPSHEIAMDLSNVLQNHADFGPCAQGRCLTAMQLIFQCKVCALPPFLSAVHAALQTSEAQLRSRGVLLLAHMICKLQGTVQLEAVATVLAFVDDCDPRVRESGLRGLRAIHDSGINLPLCMYSSVVVCLLDDVPAVRSAAAHAVLCVAIGHAGRACPGRPQVTIADDAFNKLCELVLDVSALVRGTAATLLGALPRGAVQPAFLLQALSKQVLTQRQLTNAALEVEQAEEGEFVIDADARLLEDLSGAGAFVHGLEDEFSSVRIETISSVSELAVASPVFRAKAVDVLVDMLNDEIDAVRVHTVAALARVSTQVKLREAQLSVLLGSLDDRHSPLRESVRRLLAGMTLANPTCLLATTKALQSNISKYPEDASRCLECIANVARKHPSLAEQLTPVLLSADPHFLTTEPDIDDFTYAVALAVAVAAARHNANVLASLPRHCMRHAATLHERLPRVFPALVVSPITGGAGLMEVDESHVVSFPNRGGRDDDIDIAAGDGEFDVVQLDARTYITNRVVSCQKSMGSTSGVLAKAENYGRVRALMAESQRSLQGACAWIGPGRGSAQFAFQMAGALAIVAEIQQLGLLRQPNSSSLLPQRLRGYLLRMSHMFLGLTDLHQVVISELSSFCEVASGSDPLPGLARLLQCYRESGVAPAEELLPVASLLSSSEGSLRIDVALRSAWSRYWPRTLSHGCFKMARAVLLHPTPTAHRILDVDFRLPWPLTVVASLEDTDVVENVAIHVALPGQTSLIFAPPPCAWTPMSQLRHRLKHHVSIAFPSQWIGPGELTVSIVKVTPSGVIPISSGVTICLSRQR